MGASKLSQLRFNFGFMLDAGLGTSRQIELAYPRVRLEDGTILKPLQGQFQASRTSRGIYLSGLLITSVATECSRCLSPLRLPLDLELDDLFYFQGTAPEGEYEVGDDGMLDLAPLVRELSLLAVPMQPFCQPFCRGLCSICGQNLNEGQCDCRHEEIDPRLAALQTLLDSAES